MPCLAIGQVRQGGQQRPGQGDTELPLRWPPLTWPA